MSQAMQTIIANNFVSISGLVLLLSMLFRNNLFNDQQRKAFFMAIIVNCLMIVAMGVNYYFYRNGIASAYIVRRIVSFINFSCCPLLPAILLRVYKTPKYKLLFYIPTIINAIICFASMFYPLVFFFNEVSDYSRGVLFFLPFVATLFYFLFLFIHPATKYYASKLQERVLLAAIIIVMMLCVLMETFWNKHFLSTNAAAVGIIIYFLFLTMNFFSKDTLTGAYNRQMYNRRLNEISGKKSCCLAILDVNNLKFVNDTMGHSAGDELLVNFVQVLNEHLHEYGELYRVGGDEFIYFIQDEHFTTFLESIESVHESAAQKGIYFAMGALPYLPEDDLDEVLSKIDVLMYEDKRIRKSNLEKENNLALLQE